VTAVSVSSCAADPWAGIEGAAVEPAEPELVELVEPVDPVELVELVELVAAPAEPRRLAPTAPPVTLARTKVPPIANLCMGFITVVLSV
jgi:hypothetical protein